MVWRKLNKVESDKFGKGRYCYCRESRLERGLSMIFEPGHDEVRSETGELNADRRQK